MKKHIFDISSYTNRYFKIFKRIHDFLFLIPGFNAEDIANQKGQHACSHLLIEHNNKQSGSVASTPRMPSISSRTTTPRQENNSDLMFGLPATNMANGKKMIFHKNG